MTRPDPLDRTTAIQSIRPQYVDRILNGTKTVEFRRQPLPASVERVLIWRTGKDGGIAGSYRIRQQVTAPTDHWWMVADERPQYGVTADDLLAYASGCPSLTGIEVADVVRYPRTLRLGLARGPQSWQYAPAGWETALSLATSEATS